MSKLIERGPAALLRKSINDLQAQVKELRLVNGIGYRAKRTSCGTALEILQSKKTDAAASNIQRFKIVNFQNSFLNCVKTNSDGTSIGGTEYQVMVPYLLRSTTGLPDGYVENSLGWNPTTQKRTFSINGLVNKTYQVEQALQPIYDVGDYIFAAGSINGGTETDDPITTSYDWVDLNVDGRAWHYTMKRVGVCVNDSIQYLYIAGSEVEVTV